MKLSTFNREVGLREGCASEQRLRCRRPTFEELSSAFLVFVRGPMIEDRMYFVFLFFQI